MDRRRTAVLVHGFLRTGRNMRPLARRLEAAGYNTVVAELDTRFGTFERALDSLSATVARAGTGRPLRLVGHSLGGLLIRHLLAREAIPHLGPSVLIGAPADGSPLARTGQALLRPFPRSPIPLFDALVSGLPAIPPPMGATPLGVIAGTGLDFPEGYCFAPWFRGAVHDGRVALDATRFDGMADFKIVPFGHRVIHHRPETAQLVLRFFETARFRATSPPSDSRSVPAPGKRPWPGWLRLFPNSPRRISTPRAS